MSLCTNCFKSAFKGKNLENQILYDDIDLPRNFSLESFTMQLDLEIRNRFNDFDEDVDINALIENESENHEIVEEETEEEAQTDIITPMEFLHNLSAIRNFVQSQGASENIHSALSELEKFGLSKKFAESTKQSRITSFFK